MEIKKEVMRWASETLDLQASGVWGGGPVKGGLQISAGKTPAGRFVWHAPHRMSSLSKSASESPGWHSDLLTLPSLAGKEKFLAWRE